MGRLTGKIRFSLGRKFFFFSVLKLQVEVERMQDCESIDPGSFYTEWRDAKIEDLSSLIIKSEKNNA